MKNIIVITVLLGCIILAGCENKQAKIDKLQADYNQAHKQYYNDCLAPAYGGTDTYLKGTKPKLPTPQEEAAKQQKCMQEAKRAGDLQIQLQAAFR